MLPVFSQTNFFCSETAVDNDSTAIGFLGFINTSGSARGLVDPSESKNSNEDKASEEREVSAVRFLLYHTYILHIYIYVYSLDS